MNANLERYIENLTNEVTEYKRNKESQVNYYTFKSNDNNFWNVITEKTLDELKWFKILSKLQRFFYSIKVWENYETCMTNVILNHSENLSFYKWWKIQEINWKTEFTYKELVELSRETKWMNKKIIIIWILDWKLTKLESSYTSETPFLRYLSENTKRTVDIKWEERRTRENKIYNILSFRESETQINITNEEFANYLNKLELEFIRMNQSLKEEAKKEEKAQEEVKEVDLSPSFDYSEKPF